MFLSPKEVIPKLARLNERQLAELYGILLPRAMEMNPMRDWVMTMNPTKEQVAELLQMMPPDTVTDINDLYVGG